MGPKTEFTASSIPKVASTYPKNTWPKHFSGGFTNAHGDKDISADKRTQK